MGLPKLSLGNEQDRLSRRTNGPLDVNNIPGHQSNSNRPHPGKENTESAVGMLRKHTNSEVTFEDEDGITLDKGTKAELHTIITNNL